MIVTCNECESSFNVDDSLIKADGSKVRCSKCSSVFVVHPEVPESELGGDADDLALDLDDGLDEGLDSDDELADLDMDSGADDELPDTGVGLDWERILSPLFISSPDYGTRSSSIVLIAASGHVTVMERTFLKAEDDVKEGETRKYSFTIKN